jgi:hypothetical protein
MGHSVLAFGPGNISTTATSQACSFKLAEHLSIYVLFGAEAGSPPAAPTSINVYQCTTAGGANATAMSSGFRYYYQLLGGAGNDILNGDAQALTNTVGPGPNWTSGNSGITSFPASVSNLVYIIEMDSAEVEIIAQSVGSNTEYPYIQVEVASTAATPLTILYVFTGLRYAYKGGQTFTT